MNINIIRGLIYILQRESYDARRFLFFVYHNWRWWSLEKRQEIVWTTKAKFLYGSVLVSGLALIFLLVYFLRIRVLIALFFLVPSLPLFILLILILLLPLDYLLKKRIVIRARRELLKSHVKVVGITGSYGKTSLKEILVTVLGAGFKVVATPDNINTDLGIANFILAHSAEISASDFFIVEMGAYRVGDIAAICDLVSPDYSFLTGVNESHLERFGNLQNTIKAKFELGERTTKKVILNLADTNVKDNYSRFKLAAVSGVDYAAAQNLVALPSFSGWSFKYGRQDFSTRLLARHNIVLIVMALTLAEELKMDLKLSVGPLATMPFIKHRLEPIWNASSRLMVIDDSYNGNFAGFISGLEVLRRATGRKLVITPGLVELGEKKEERHREIARLYSAENLDLVILIENSATFYIISEFKKIGFGNYKTYPDTTAAHRDLGAVLKEGDTIIFQNDWPDNYK